jgi:hypothetical protein
MVDIEIIGMGCIDIAGELKGIERRRESVRSVVEW